MSKDLEVILGKVFSDLYKKIDERIDSIEVEDYHEMLFQFLNDFFITDFNDKLKKNQIQITWINIFNQSLNLACFWNRKTKKFNDFSKKISFETLTEDFKLTNEPSYYDLVFSSDQWNEKLQNPDLILEIGKENQSQSSIFHHLNIKDNKKEGVGITLMQIFDELNKKNNNYSVNKYNKALEEFTENVYVKNNFNEFGTVKSKFINWIYWVYNLYNPADWRSIFYISSFIPYKLKKDFNGIKLEEIRCNIGINYEGTEHDKDIITITTFLKTLVNQLTYIELAIHNKSNLRRARISSIISRNSAHHIESHISHRVTPAKVKERINWSKLKKEKCPDELDNYQIALDEMQARFSEFRSGRNDFIAGIDSNTHPVTVRFYQDIIVPFVESSLIMDNIAKSEGVSWQKKDSNDVLTGGEVSKLRIRVFYHNDLQLKQQNGNAKEHGKNKGDCTIPLNYKPNKDDENPIHCSKNNCNKKQNKIEIFESELGLEKYHEICMFYKGVLDPLFDINETICIHELPYFRQYNKKEWYKEHTLNCNDIEITVPGTLGKHSWWSMLENHIRNTAKHANRELLSKASHLDIIIKVSNLPEEVKSKENVEKRNLENKAYYQVELTSNIPTLEFNESKAKDKDGKEESTPYGRIKEYCKIDISSDKASLGIADMRINATLLKFEPINRDNLYDAIEVNLFERSHELEEEKYKKVVNEKKEEVNAFDEKGNLIPSNASKYNYSLNYTFKLTKPCKVVIIDPNINEKEYHDVDKGIYAYKDYKECIRELSGKRRSFQFAVISSAVFEDKELFDSIKLEYGLGTVHKIDELLAVLPWRVMVFRKDGSEIDLKSLGKRVTQISEFCISETYKNADNKLLEDCWEIWMMTRWNKSQNGLCMYFENDEKLEKRYYGSLCKENKREYYNRANEFLRVDVLRNENGNKKKDIEFEKNRNYVVYDRHQLVFYEQFKWQSNDHDPRTNSENLLDKDLLKFNASWFYLGKSNFDFDLINGDSLNNSKVSFCKLTEAGLKKVLIVDERISSIALEKSEIEVRILKESFWLNNDNNDSKIFNQGISAGLFIADSFKVGSEEILYNQESALLSYCINEDSHTIEGRYSRLMKDINFDALIIHRTMLDKIISKDNNKYFNYLSLNFPHIIVCTGGGTLSYKPEVMARVRKISFSALQQFIKDKGIAKNSLINIL